MEQPPSYTDPDKSDYICILLRSIYGLKQSGRSWYIEIHDFLINVLHFTCFFYNHALFFHKTSISIIFLVIYVDNVLIIGDNLAEIKKLKQEIDVIFTIKIMGDASYYLGTTIKHN
jgi:hypothetical protein